MNFPVNHNTVLTAGHCFDEHDLADNIKKLWVYLGLGSLLKFTANPYLQIMKIKKVTVHSNFNRKDILDNDIAVVVLERSVEWSFGVSPVCMPDKTVPETLSHMTFVILGFGRMGQEKDSSKILMKAQVHHLENESCLPHFEHVENYKHMIDGKFCMVSNETNHMDTCSGDSGGPVIYKANRDYLVGIVSGGLACGVKIPSVNVRVTEYIDWINKHVNN